MAERERSEDKHLEKEAKEDCCGGHHDHESELETLEKNIKAEAPVAEEVTQNTTVGTDWKLQAQYLAAEIDNMQKRFARETSEIRKYANEDILKRLVPVLDTLSLALDAAAKAKVQVENAGLFESKVFSAFLKGVDMTAKQFEQLLAASGVEFIESVGKEFDPNMHEALGQSKVESTPNNVITEEFQKGFKLAGRVIRPAKVIVNKI